MKHEKTLRELLPSLRRLLRRFWPCVRRQRLLLAISFSALFGEVFLLLLEPWPLKFVFDRVIVVSSTGGGAGIPAINGPDLMVLLALPMLAIVAITGLRAIAAYWAKIGFALIGNRVLAEVRNQLYRHLQCLSLSFHTRAKSGDLIIRVVGDISQLREAVVTAALPLFASLLILVSMVGLTFWLNWKLALVALAPAPLFWLRAVRLSRRIHEASRKQRKQQGAMAATAAESIAAMKAVQALSLEETFAEAFSHQNTKDLKQGVQAKRLTVHLERTVDVLIAIATALVLGYGAWLVVAHDLTPGDLLVFLAYLKKAYKPLQHFAKYTGKLAKATAAGERVLEILETEPDVRDLPGATPAPVFQGAIRFEDVSFAYEPGYRVLEKIDIDVYPGQRVALVGPSGSGKSTLVSLLLRLYDPEHGRVMIDRRDIRDYTLESLRSQISVVLQESLLFAESIRDNIAYGMPDATSEEIEAAARVANAHTFIEALPQGYDTVLSERGVTLSGGQRQRIAIARAVIRKAPILILDEPTLGLDEENERAVIKALDCLAQGPTTFLITHDLSLTTQNDLILYLEGGRVLECGTYAELMEANGRYAFFYKLQTATATLEN